MQEVHVKRATRIHATNLLETFESWTDAFDNGLDLDVIYLDYKKAFEMVPHIRLITKFEVVWLRKWSCPLDTGFLES